MPTQILSPRGSPAINTNHDRKLAGILEAAARVFARIGYDRCSIREVAEAAGVSVPGLYYYVRSKEELLYLIQLHAFGSLVERFKRESCQVEAPEARLELLIRNHLDRFLNNIPELAVCAREIDRLKGEYQSEIEAIRREYFAIAVRIFADLSEKHGPLTVDPRTAALAMFGSINWAFTWYRPGAGPSARSVAADFVRLSLEGVLPRGSGPSAEARQLVGAKGASDV
jgi:TetR/AcrR family transcriptional regulator, cholesterol catabolism regulator